MGSLGKLRPIIDSGTNSLRISAPVFKAEELAIVRDFMREAKEVFERQISGAAPCQKKPPRAPREQTTAIPAANVPLDRNDAGIG